jgi:uncharacterized protein (TIGR00369 family)
MTFTEIAKDIFDAAAFVRDVGLEFDAASEGECTTLLRLQSRHLQQNGVVHAAVQFTMADHTAGAAASTLAPVGAMVLTVEIKISLLKAARGEQLTCKARVIKAGRRLSFVESEVYCLHLGTHYLASKATATIAMTPQSDD